VPAKDVHLLKAERNEGFALSLPLDWQPRIDWALIALFYSAMHYVEAYFANRNTHIRSHTARDNAIGRDPNLRKIFAEYQDLKFYGYNARYEPPQFTAEDVIVGALPQFNIVKAHISTLLRS